MSKAYDSIKQGLDEALAFSKGKKTKAVVHEFKPLDAWVIHYAPFQTNRRERVGNKLPTLRTTGRVGNSLRTISDQPKRTRG